ncbi:iron-containing alcohol dehydrogenase family protein [Xylophilus sp. GOD-11R]|uniref:iron-containing alcohol dehydrogenase family protein n=1 Tax=Xylophilus sp. GOD-11R TaxID=3089814 RepID=UPI00298C0016|nr:iron-containing alcohol dehydrogenase family protein [Xylophilus sp. GOD-11R]WPB55898.1 iron-containing alcohol dehydrogenase family protein [Xylophilus sp. GOD-11R]
MHSVFPHPHFSDFQYLAPELRLHCGVRSLAALAQEVRRAGCSRAVVVTGRSVGASPALQALRDALGDVLVGESHAVKPDSPMPAVAEVAARLHALQADAVIAVGGGSAAVTGRAAAILLAEERPAEELCTRRLPDGRFDSPRLSAPKLAQFVVPTTPSTAFVKAGSAVHDPASGRRMALFDPKTRARAIALDPGLLASAPPSLVLEAGLNTLSTAIEALETPRCDPFSEAWLMQAIRLVARHLGGRGEDDPAARAALAVSAVLCGRGTEQSGGGLASVLAHAIGRRSTASNGIVNAIVLPYTLGFNASATAARRPRVAEALGAGDAVETLQALLAGLAVPRRLREIGIEQTHLPEIAEAAMSDWFISRNPRTVVHADEVLELLQAAW